MADASQQPLPQQLITISPADLKAVVAAILQGQAQGRAPTGRIPPGALLQYYSDLSSGLIPPEDMRIEDLQFRVQIDPAGNVVAESPKVTLLSRFNFAFRRVTGFIMNPALSGAAASLVSFQVQEQGRNFSVFKRPVSMQSVVGSAGAGNPAEWDGVYITIPGTDLAVNWTVDSRWAALVGTTQEMGVQLLGDYVVCRGGF